MILITIYSIRNGDKTFIINYRVQAGVNRGNIVQYVIDTENKTVTNTTNNYEHTLVRFF